MAIQHKARAGYMSDIIQINSKSGLQGSNKNGAYAGSKFGSIGLTQSFALELIEDGKNGFLREFDDVQGFLDIISQVREDSALRERIVAAGMETVRKHTWETAAQQMEQVLGQLSGVEGAMAQG